MLEVQTPTSSNVAMYGYLSDDKVLLVRYRDGTLYARTGIEPAIVAALNAAQSKGAFLSGLANPSVRISGAQPAQAAPLTVGDMRKQQKPSSAADCSFAVLR